MAFEQRVRIILETVTGNAKKGIDDFKSSVSSAETSVGKFRGGVSSLVSTFKSAATSPVAVAAGIGAVVGVAGKAVNAFKDLGVAVGKFSDATGIGEEDSSRLIEVFDDLGVSTEQAQTAIGKMEKALGANVDAFKQYGISVVRAKDGTVDANATFIAAIGALNAIRNPTERAAAASAVFGKSWASMAEVIEGGSGKLKAGLEAVQTSKVFGAKDVKAARDLREGFDSIKDAGEGLFLTLGKALAPTIAELAPQIGKVVTAAGPLVEVIGTKLAGAFKIVEPAIKLATGALDLWNKSQETYSRLIGNTRGQDELEKAAGLVETSSEKAALAQENLAGVVDGTATRMIAAIKAAEGTSGALDGTAVSSQTLANALIHQDDVISGLTETVDGLDGAFAGAAAAAIHADDKIASAGTRSAKAWKGWAEVLGSASFAADQVAATQSAFADALAVGAEAASGSIQANLNLDDSYASLRKSFKENGKSVDQSTEKGRDNIRAILDTGDAIRDNLLQQLKDSGNSYEQVTDAADMYREQLADQLRQAGLTEEQIAEYIHTLGLTPEQVETAIKLSGQAAAKSALDSLNVQLDDIPDEKKTEYIAAVQTGDFETALALVKNLSTSINNIPTSKTTTVTVTSRVVGDLSGAAAKDFHGVSTATGGPVRAGEAYLVGDGPGGSMTPWSELFIPSTDGTILNNPDTRKALQSRATGGSTGRTQNVSHVTLPGASSGAVVGTVDDALKEQDRLQAALFETNRLSLADYKKYVEGRLAASADLSDDYLTQFRLLDQLTEQEQSKADKDKTAADAAVKNQDDVKKAMFETGEISLQAYEDYLKGRLGSYQAYTTDWLALYNQIKGLNDQEIRDAADATKAMYTQAQAIKAVAEAEAEQAKQLEETFAVGVEGGRVMGDRRSTADDRSQAVEDLTNAQTKLADTTYRTILAKATAANLDTGSVEWDRFVRSLLSAAIDDYNSNGLTVTASALTGQLSGIPALAAGGIVRARHGGTLARLGEAGRDEAVVPLDGRALGTTVIHNTITVNTLTGKLSPRDVDYLRNELERGNRRNGQ